MINPEEFGVTQKDLDGVLNLSAEKAKAEILRLERYADENMTAPDSWDAYFGLMHECDERNFTEEFERLKSKIDLGVYDPFKSKDPGIVMLARHRFILFTESEQNKQ